MEKNSEINGLHEDDNAVTVIVPRKALCCALVEFSARTSAAFVHG